MTANQTPRAHVHLPGFEFIGYGEGYLLPMFGPGVKIDVYRKLGGITAEVRNMTKQQIAAHPDDPHKWHMLTGKDHGHTNVYIRAS